MNSLQADQVAQARRLIVQAGGRATPARINVLGVLLAAPGPLSHLDVLAAMTAQADRVTVYRVLEWLYEVGVVHKLSGDDRVWRFACAPSHLHRHAHFQCTACGRFFCLDQVSTEQSWALPARFKAEQIEITVKGLCADCR